MQMFPSLASRETFVAEAKFCFREAENGGIWTSSVKTEMSFKTSN